MTHADGETSISGDDAAWRKARIGAAAHYAVSRPRVVSVDAIDGRRYKRPGDVSQANRDAGGRSV